MYAYETTEKWNKIDHNLKNTYIVLIFYNQIT